MSFTPDRTTTFMVATRQIWKLYATALVVFGCFAGCVVIAIRTRNLDPSVLLISFGGMLALGGLAFFWFLWSVQCPKCGIKLAWLLASRHSLASFATLNTLTQCPNCGYLDQAS
jgi:hypothetical protein